MNNCITCKKNNKGDSWRNCGLKCHYKYEQMEKDEIYILQKEKEQLQKRFNDYQDRKIEENANLMKRLDIADKKLTVFSRELEQANKENEELKRKCEENKTVILQLQQWQDEDLRQIAELKRIKDDFFKQAEISHEAVLNKNKIIEKLEKERDKYKYHLEEIKGTIEHFKTYFSEKELNKVKFSDITVIEEIISEAIGE